MDQVYLNKISSRFKSYSDIKSLKPGSGHAHQQFHIRHNKLQHHKSPKKCGVQKFKKNNEVVDLRLLISLKRRENEIKEILKNRRSNEAATNIKYKQGGVNQLSTHFRRKTHYSLDPNKEGGVNYNDYEHLNYYNHKKQDCSSPYSSHIRRTSCNFNANEEENDEDNEWLDNANYKHNDIKQHAFSPHPSRIRRKSYSYSANDEDNDWLDNPNNKHNDRKQRAFSPHPARIRRRSYSFSANKRENDEDNEWIPHSKNIYTYTNQDDASSSPAPIRKRSYSFSENKRENYENNEWLQHSDNKYTYTNQDDDSSHPAPIGRRNHSFSENLKGENYEANEWLEHLNTKLNDTEEGSFRPHASHITKRRYSFNTNQEGENDEATNQTDFSPPQSPLNEEINDDDDNNMWLEENLESQEAINPTEAYTNLLGVKESSNVTFIVPDLNVFLKNINLLNDILNEDKQCCLLIPQIVMSKIQIATKSQCKAQAYTALSFIWQKHEANLAVIEKETEENESSDDDLLQFCCQLIDQKIQVVLLTDDTELINNTNTNNTNICIKTTTEMRKIVNEYKSKEATTANLDTEGLSHVKITIPNKSISQHDEKNIKSPIRKYINPERGLDEKRAENQLCAKKGLDEKRVENQLFAKKDLDEKKAENRVSAKKGLDKKSVENQLYAKKGLDEKRAENQLCANVLQNNRTACDVAVQASFKFNSVSSPIITGNIREEVQPDSNKTNNNEPFKTGAIRLKRKKPHDLSLNTKITDNEKMVIERHRNRAKLTFSSPKDGSKVGNEARPICPLTDSTINETALSNNVSLTWSQLLNTSSESLYKINEGSDTSSSIYKNVNPRGNITIEETSNSVISNTTSNSESDRAPPGVANDRIVTLKVVDARMEEALRVKADEWVSRFVQVMEEALSQLLQREPSFALEPMPPPWTVHEAAECVRKHFAHEPDVVDAADRLLAVSRDHGGLRGKIKSNISPQKYMELYSYGVHLIDALQRVLSGNEDLQTAAEALSKLLNDIQQSHLDAGNQDSFTDISAQECEANVTADRDTSQTEVNQGDEKVKILKESPRRNKKKPSPASTPGTPGKYNLRSQRKKDIEENTETSDTVTMIRNVDSESSFFSSLYLKKISNDNSETVTEKPQLIIGLRTSDDNQEKIGSPGLQKIDEHITSSGESTNPILNGDPKMNEPKIIRNFFKCVEFEEKLKNKTELLSDQDYLDRDDEEERRLYIHEEQYSGDYGNEAYMNSEYYINFDENIWSNDCIAEETSFNNNLEMPNDLIDICKKQTGTFKNLMGGLESDIRKAFSSIQDFCVRSSERLHSEELSVDDTRRMEARAEQTSMYISKICDQLKKVLTRENSPHSIFQAILKRKELAHIVIEDNDREDYRDFISNCLEQGNILKESVELVLEACKLTRRS